MRRFIPSIVALCLVLGISATAATVSVENFSFEQPATGKLKNWDSVPGWSSDTVAADSGVESDWPGSTEGSWSGFMMASDPSVYNLTNHIISAGEIIQLEVDARDNWSETTPASLKIDLYYFDGSNRVQAATTNVELTTTWTGFSVSFTADDMPESIGKLLGIELDNITTGGSWIGLDNVLVTVIPEPVTISLLGIGGLVLLRRRK